LPAVSLPLTSLIDRLGVASSSVNGGYLDIDFLKLEENHLNKI
jgi:hypothetical protein